VSAAPDLGPAAAAPRHAGWLADQLPRPLAEDPGLRGFLRIFEETVDTVRDDIDSIEHLLDPCLAPPPFVRMLGAWLGVTVDPLLPEQRQRQLVQSVGRLLPWRGTRRGLEGVLASLTGSEVQVSDEGGVFTDGPAPAVAPRITVRIASTGGVDEQYLLAVVRAEVPAHATVSLVVHEHTVDAVGRPEVDTTDASQALPEPLDGTGYLPPDLGSGAGPSGRA
jgi:phage tail-like protein